MQKCFHSMIITCQCVTCFIQRTGIYQSLIMFVEVNHVPNKGDYCGPLKVDVAHQARQGYKTISKEIGLHKYTVRQILYKLRKFETTVSFTRSGQTTKITPKQVPWETSEQLKAFFTLANVNVHEPTIRRTLSNHGVHGRVARSCKFSKNTIAC